MRDKNTGQPHGVVQLTNQTGGNGQRNRVQPRERLVVHHQLRVQRNGAGQRNAACHTARQVAGHQVARASQAHGIEFHQHNVPNQGLRQVGVLAQRKGHVIKHAQVRKQGTELKQHAHAPPSGVHLGLVHGGHVLAVKQELAFLGPNLSANQAQNRRFSPARGPHQRGDFAPWHGHGDVVQNHPLPVPKSQVAQFDKRIDRRGGH